MAGVKFSIGIGIGFFIVVAACVLCVYILDKVFP